MMDECFSIRAVTREDLDAVVDLTNTAVLFDTGKPETSLEEKKAEWDSSELDITRDCRLVTDRNRRPVGYIEVWNGPPYTRPNAWGCVHPDARGLGIGYAMASWAEDHARSRMILAEPEKRIAYMMHTPTSNREAADLFTLLGLGFIRRFFRMKIDLDPLSPPEQPVFPQGIRIRTFRPGIDNRLLYDAMQEAFTDHWDHVPVPIDIWLERHIEAHDFDPETFFIAVSDKDRHEQIAGASLCFPTFAEEPGCAYIDELGVRRPWRRKGIALALLRHSFKTFHKRGIYSIQLGVDSKNPTGATALYEKAGMRIVRRTDLYVKELRPGKD